MLTTEDYKDRMIYIIGKCKNENIMNIVEKIVLNKLDHYREVANRDRFVLPIDKDITFFTNIIDESVIII